MSLGSRVEKLEKKMKEVTGPSAGMCWVVSGRKDELEGKAIELRKEIAEKYGEAYASSVTIVCCENWGTEDK